VTTTFAPQRFGDLVASELRKLTSLLSNRVILVVTVVAMVGLALLGSEIDLHEGRRLLPPGAPFHPTIVSHGLAGASLVQFILAVVGTLAFTSEVSSGTIRASLAASPNRVRLVAAKGLVFLAVTLVIGIVTSALGVLTAALVLHSVSRFPGLTGTVVSSVVGTGCYLALLGLLGLGLGVLIRRSSGAIFTLVVGLLILPILANFLPANLAPSVERLLPLQIGDSMILQASDHTLPGALPPWVGLAVLAGYTLVILALGTWRLVRADL
jgi:ABC-2 type transport system permease protein